MWGSLPCETPTMKEPFGVCLLAVAAITGCSVDVGKLRAVAAKGADAAADGAPDRLPDIVADATGDVDDSGAPPDEPTATADGDGAVDDGSVGDVEGLGDATDSPELGESDATLDDDASATADLPEDTPDLPEASPDLPEDSPDLPEVSPDLAPTEVEDSATPDVSPETSEADAASDLAAPADASDAGGLSTGSACTSADQCQSGFCIASRCCVQSCASACYRANQCSRSGSCTAVAGTITCGDLDALCGLTVYDYANASEWSLRTNLQVGDVATGSDQHTLSTVPSALRGSPWLRPSRNSKSATMNPLLTFTLSAPADVYVGIDTRVSAPSWLSGWTDSGMTISYVVYSTSEPTTTVTQRLHTARFPAGSVSLGPLGCISTSDCSMYLTLIRFADQPSGTAPSCR